MGLPVGFVLEHNKGLQCLLGHDDFQDKVAWLLDLE